ncbi:unnamed protein product, partial [Mycena citricolor]
VLELTDSLHDFAPRDRFSAVLLLFIQSHSYIAVRNCVLEIRKVGIITKNQVVLVDLCESIRLRIVGWNNWSEIVRGSTAARITQFSYVTPDDDWLITQPSSHLASSQIVILVFTVAVIDTQTVPPFLLPQLSLYSSLMELLNLQIVFVDLLLVLFHHQIFGHLHLSVIHERLKSLVQILVVLIFLRIIGFTAEPKCSSHLILIGL